MHDISLLIVGQIYLPLSLVIYQKIKEFKMSLRDLNHMPFTIRYSMYVPKPPTVVLDSKRKKHQKII